MARHRLTARVMRVEQGEALPGRVKVHLGQAGGFGDRPAVMPENVFNGGAVPEAQNGPSGIVNAARKVL